MVKIHIVGDIQSPTGYGIHCRQLSNALNELGADVSLEKIADTSQLTETEIGLMSKDNSRENLIMITQPLFWQTRFAGPKKKLIGFGVFEGDRIPTAFVEPSDKVDMIFCPSTHSKKAFEKAGVTTPIHIIPHGVDTDLFKPSEPLEGLKADKGEFTFLFVGGWAKGEKDRKALHVALRAFCAEFKKEEKVRFLAKINPVYTPLNFPPQMSLAEREQIVGNFYRDQMDKLKLPSLENRPKIVLNMQLRPFSELPSLYSTGDVFVMPTKAEGFCMPVVEAMACGLPVIATGFGGQTDVINEKVGRLIDYKLAPASDPDIQFEETKWAEPDQAHLQKLMREMFENRELVKELGKNAVEEAQNWTWKKAAEKVIEVLK